MTSPGSVQEDRSFLRTLVFVFFRICVFSFSSTCIFPQNSWLFITLWALALLGDLFASFSKFFFPFSNFSLAVGVLATLVQMHCLSHSKRYRSVLLFCYKVFLIRSYVKVIYLYFYLSSWIYMHIRISQNLMCDKICIFSCYVCSSCTMLSERTALLRNLCFQRIYFPLLQA